MVYFDESSISTDKNVCPSVVGQSIVCLCCCLVTKLSLTLVNAWTIAHQAPLSMGFPRQECWIGLPFPSPENLSHSGIETTSPALQVASCTAGGFFTTELPSLFIFQ